MKQVVTIQDYPLVHHVVWVVDHVFKWGKQTPFVQPNSWNDGGTEGSQNGSVFFLKMSWNNHVLTQKNFQIELNIRESSFLK